MPFVARCRTTKRGAARKTSTNRSNSSRNEDTLDHPTGYQLNSLYRNTSSVHSARTTSQCDLITPGRGDYPDVPSVEVTASVQRKFPRS